MHDRSDSLHVLAVMAHPDDAELLCGGALLKSADRGERTGILDLTAGEAGSRGSRELREREAADAAAVLGLAVRRNAGLPDAGLRNTEEARRTVVAHLRRLRPRIVITHWTEGRHPDHREAARLVRDAAFLAGLRRYDAPGDPFRPLQVVYATAFREDVPPPSFVIDITAQMERKLEAIACYPSQFAGVRGMGELFPSGERSLPELIRAHAAVTGSRIRTGYGEPFITAETLRIESLGALSVSSF